MFAVFARQWGAQNGYSSHSHALQIARAGTKCAVVIGHAGSNKNLLLRYVKYSEDPASLFNNQSAWENMSAGMTMMGMKSLFLLLLLSKPHTS